ncbi:MAG: hypothetical protein P1P93_10255 [Gammaproteobacteria bacterium]|nr:hypothetical protein [Gammaproteobacteria bacterium]
MIVGQVGPGSVVMSEWNIVIIELEDGTVIEKFLGFDTSTRTYRISSQIYKYDQESDTGITVSSSTYRLQDKPGKLHPSAQEVFDFLQSQPTVKATLKYPCDDA